MSLVLFPFALAMPPEKCNKPKGASVRADSSLQGIQRNVEDNLPGLCRGSCHEATKAPTWQGADPLRVAQSRQMILSLQ